MDLSLSPSEQAFRDELREWLGANHPGKPPSGDEAAFQFSLEWQRTLNEGGWAGVSWPEEYGGRGASLMEQAIFSDEMVRADAPSPANVLGLAMGGPTVIAHGTDAQKERYVAPILSGEEIWCQGFSEPDSGSDLASLKTKAVKDNGEWRVTGQKVWTTLAHHAKWCMLVARTDPDAPKHKGLTYFLMDMEQDEVQVSPLTQITGEAEFNELFMDGARIPDENVIGGVGNGWGVAITTLMHERSGLAFALQGQVKRDFARLLELARERGAGDDPVARQRLAQLYIGTESLRLNVLRALTGIMKSGQPGPEGSLGKWQWSDLNQELTEAAMDVRGAEAPVVDDDDWTYRFLRARANSIEGGTTEILKNIVAERVLGLPEAAVNFDFTDDQQAIKRTANEFLAARFTPDRRRELAEAGDYDEGVWKEMSELGWPGIFIGEDHGGQELGTTELAILSEELGYALAPSPFLSNAAAGLLLEHAGSDEQKAKWLPGVASGEALGTVGVVTGGVAPLVPDAAEASFVVLVDGDQATVLEGVSAEPLDTIDSTRRYARVEAAEGEALGGDVSAGLDRIAVLLAAELTGVAQRAMEMAVEYAREREQFGRPIGAYQAVAHRCAEMLLETESARATMLFAAYAADHEPESLPLAAATAKSCASDAGWKVTASSLQVHGGIGFTWEHDLHFFLKRAKADAHLYGSATEHRERVADLLQLTA